jgi:heme exporter protein A
MKSARRVQKINHIVVLTLENRSFDWDFSRLVPVRHGIVRYDAAHGPIPANLSAKPAKPGRKIDPALPLGITAMRLSAVDLACRRGGREVFAGVSFRLGRGEALAVTGRNGAGKSSLLRIVGGFIRPASGRLWLEGGDPEFSISEQAHYLGHQDAVKPSLSVVENLQFWADFFGDGAVKVHDALDSVGLGAIAALPAAYLSAGQRRRLSIARLLVVKRPIWLLDEPASTLDSAGKVRLAGFMRSHLADGGLILAATHGELGLSIAQELSLDRSVPSHLAGENPYLYDFPLRCR